MLKEPHCKQCLPCTQVSAAYLSHSVYFATSRVIAARPSGLRFVVLKSYEQGGQVCAAEAALHSTLAEACGAARRSSCRRTRWPALRS